MEFIVVMLAGCVLAIPVIAIVALVRTGRLRDSLDERLADQINRIRDLEAQISSLRRDLSQMQTIKRPEATAVAPPALEVRPATAATAPKPSPAESAGPSPATEPVKIATTSPVPSRVAVHSVPPPIAAFQSPSAAQANQMLPPAEAPKLATPIPAASSPEPIPAPPRPPVPPPQPAAATNPPFAAASAAPFLPSFETMPPRKTIAERLRTALPLEEVLGMNLFAKIGIVLLVLGFALLGRVALISMGNGERVALIYAVAGVMLGGGVWLERKERYRLVGRTGIGGGWALLFFTTYAMHYVSPMMVLRSNTLDCILMLVVAVAMVGHTLRYNSQLVTGLAFLLAFSTVALSQDTVYSLAAGVILAVGIVAIVLRKGWFELEIFGILASYANHFYWLYKLYPDGVAGHSFQQFWPSAILLVLYWGVFRVSYIARRIRTPRDETMSTIAALLNSVLLLAVMKFQSTRPELAFYALLALGAMEFFFGQLPITRRRRPAFILLTVLGTILIFASVPFKYSGNNIALLWMIAAEVLLIAGIVQLEVVFRRLGLLGSAFTGLLILYGARGIVELRQTSQSPLIRDGVLLLACGILFYFNAHFLRPKWDSFFAGIDRALMTGQSYLGAVTAFLGIWAIFCGDWTAVGWAALMLAAAYGKRYLDDNHLMIQGWAFAGSVLIAAYIQNSHLSDPYPHHVLARLITLPILAGAFYLMAWILSGVDDSRLLLHRLSLWSGSVLLASLAWLEIKQVWVAFVLVVFAIVLSTVGRRLRIADFTFQEHCLALFAISQLAFWNFDAHTSLERYVPLIGCAVAFYAISRFCTLPEASYRKPAAWAHTWAATALLAALAWHESPQPWLAAICGFICPGAGTYRSLFRCRRTSRADPCTCVFGGHPRSYSESLQHRKMARRGPPSDYGLDPCRRALCAGALGAHARVARILRDAPRVHMDRVCTLRLDAVE